MVMPQSMIDLLDYIYFCFTFFHAVSSLSQDSSTQSSSVQSPFDPFLAIDRSYTTCFRSKKVRNSKSVNIPLKRNENKEGRRRRRRRAGTLTFS